MPFGFGLSSSKDQDRQQRQQQRAETTNSPGRRDEKSVTAAAAGSPKTTRKKSSPTRTGHVNENLKKNKKPNKAVMTKAHMKKKKKSPVSWKEAHRSTCVSRSELCSSIQQIADHGYDNIASAPDYYDKDVLLWSERQKASLEIFQRFQLASSSSNIGDGESAAIASTPSKSSSVFSLAYSAASQAANIAMMPFDMLTSPLAGTRGDYDDIPPLNAGETYIVNQEDLDVQRVQREPCAVDKEEPILNVDLTLSCLECLKQIVQTGPPQIVPLQESSSRSSAIGIVNEWINVQPTNDKADVSTATLISKLPSQQFTFLLDILVASGHVQKINQQQLGKPDLIVVSDPSTTVDVQVAIYDLDVAVDQIHSRITALEDQAGKAIENARSCKAKGNKKGALFQIQRKRNFQHEIDISYGHLDNLEKQKMALERAGDTHLIHQAMQQTAETLKNLRLSHETVTTSPEETADVLAEELEQVDATALAMTTDHVETEFDDEELLKELESYPDPVASVEESQVSCGAVNEKPIEESKGSSGTQEEEDIDVDELLDELSLLFVGNKPTNAAPIQASVFDATSSETRSSKDANPDEPVVKAEKKKNSSSGKGEKKQRQLASAICL